MLACFYFALHQLLTSGYHDGVVPREFWWSAAVLCLAPFVLPIGNRAKPISLFNNLDRICTTVSYSINVSLRLSVSMVLRLLSNNLVVNQR